MQAQQIEELFELQNVMAVNVDQDSREFGFVTNTKLLAALLAWKHEGFDGHDEHVHVQLTAENVEPKGKASKTSRADDEPEF